MPQEKHKSPPAASDDVIQNAGDAPKSAVIDYTIVAALTLMWGSAFVMIDVALERYSPAMIAFVRIAIAAAGLAPVLLVAGYSFPKTVAHWSLCAGLGFFGLSLPFTLVPFGQGYVNSATAAVLMAFGPIATLLLAHFLTHDERLTPRRIGGVLCGFTGVIALFFGDIALNDMGLGAAALLAAAFSYAVGAIIMKRLRAYSDLGSSLGTTLCAAALSFIPLALYGEAPALLASDLFSGPPFLAVLGLAVVSTALPTVLVLVLVRRRGATFSASANYGVPIVGVALAAAVRGDQVGWNILVTLALILVSLWLARTP